MLEKNRLDSMKEKVWIHFAGMERRNPNWRIELPIRLAECSSWAPILTVAAGDIDC